MTNILQQIHGHVLNKHFPPAQMFAVASHPIYHFKLAQLPCQVHQSHCDDFRLPLEAQGGAKAVVDKGPCHLKHFLKLGFVTLSKEINTLINY